MSRARDGGASLDCRRLRRRRRGRARLRRRSRRPKPAAAPAGLAGGGAAAGRAEQSKEQLLAEVRKRQLTNEDFKETANNRDPFRSFLATFATQVVNVKPQHRILLEKFAIEELKLIAIVGGNGACARGDVRGSDRHGHQAVVRGDHVSKVGRAGDARGARPRVLPDRRRPRRRRQTESQRTRGRAARGRERGAAMGRLTTNKEPS